MMSTLSCLFWRCVQLSYLSYRNQESLLSPPGPLPPAHEFLGRCREIPDQAQQRSGCCPEVGEMRTGKCKKSGNGSCWLGNGNHVHLNPYLSDILSRIRPCLNGLQEPNIGTRAPAVRCHRLLRLRPPALERPQGIPGQAASSGFGPPPREIGDQHVG